MARKTKQAGALDKIIKDVRTAMDAIPLENGPPQGFTDIVRAVFDDRRRIANKPDSECDAEELIIKREEEADRAQFSKWFAIHFPNGLR